MEKIFNTTMTADLELSLILGSAVILLGILFACVAIREYRMDLDDNYKSRPSFADFIRQEQFYLYLWLILMVVITSMIYLLTWIK